MSEGDKRSYSPRFVSRIFHLLNLLAMDENGKTLAELARSIAAPKSSILNIVQPMTELGLLIHYEGRYSLGPGLFTLGSRIVTLRKSTVVLRVILQRLAEDTGESVYISTLDREAFSMSYIDGCESRHTVRYTIKIGDSRPLHCGAGATILLAYEPRDWVEPFLRDKPLVKITPNTVIDPEQILATLKEVRANGIAISIGQSAISGAGIAAPVRNAEGEVVAAMVIATPIDRFEQSRDKLERLLRVAAVNATGLI